MNIRSLLPTDLMVLLWRGKSWSNRARTWSNLQERKSSAALASNLLEQWIFPRERRATWVYLHEGRMQGLVSARKRSGAQVWQIDYLLLAGDEENICLNLLNKLSTDGGERGVEKVFLRLPWGSPLEQAVTAAGFHTYAGEILYRAESEKKGLVKQKLASSCAFSLRPKRAEDNYGIYELYNLATPPPVRQFEGVTFGEWQGSRERGSRHERELVGEKEGSLLAWLRIATWGNTGQFEVLLHPRQEGGLEDLVAEILDYLKGCSSLLCLVPDFDPKLRDCWQACGFVEVARYSLLVKELAVKVLHPYPVPLRA